MPEDGGETPVPLTPPPGGLPQDWLEWLNRPHTDKELAALQRCIDRGVPFGREPWVKRTAADLGLESTLGPRGRQRIAAKGFLTFVRSGKGTLPNLTMEVGRDEKQLGYDRKETRATLAALLLLYLEFLLGQSHYRRM